MASKVGGNEGGGSGGSFFSMFVVGDSIERSIDGSWFLGEIQAVFPPTDTVSGECIYNIFYNDIGNTETDVPESELRLSETSAKENDETSNEMPVGKVVTTGSKCDEDDGEMAEGGKRNDGGNVVFHSALSDDNETLQSTGTAYLVHGGTSAGGNMGGSGLRAIRALKR